jgi:hypothetical protein
MLAFHSWFLYLDILGSIGSCLQVTKEKENVMINLTFFFFLLVVVGSIVGGIGLHLIYSSFQQATGTPFDTYMALATVISIMLVAVYAPFPSMRRL